MPVRPYDQRKMFLLPPSLDEWVRADHPARVVSDIVDHLDVSEFRTVHREGRPCFAPRMMLKVLLWGYASGVRASRKLAERLGADVVFMWLAGLEQPDFRTICLFRRNNPAALKRLFARVLGIARDMGLCQLGLVALDGTKVRASAGIDSFKRPAEWQKELARLEEEIQRMLDEAEAQDRTDDAAYGEDRRGDELPGELEQQQARAKRIKAILAEAERRGDKQALMSSTDIDAGYMHGPAGSLPAYNAQVAVNEHQVIVYAEVTTEPVDVNQVAPALAGIEEATGRKPERMLADAGYRSGSNLKLLEGERVDGYIPETGEKHIGRTARRESAQYGREEFRYDRERDCYSCPAGQTMTRTSERRTKTKYSKQTKRIYRARRGVCLACPRKTQCTTSDNPVGRSLTRDDYEGERARMRQKLGTEEGKTIYGRRKCLVEPAIGQLKVIGGFRQFLLRGKQGAGLEWKWMTTALNLLKMSWKVLRGEAKLAWAT